MLQAANNNISVLVSDDHNDNNHDHNDGVDYDHADRDGVQFFLGGEQQCLCAGLHLGEARSHIWAQLGECCILYLYLGSAR